MYTTVIKLCNTMPRYNFIHLFIKDFQTFMHI